MFLELEYSAWNISLLFIPSATFLLSVNQEVLEQHCSVVVSRSVSLPPSSYSLYPPPSPPRIVGQFPCLPVLYLPRAGWPQPYRCVGGVKSSSRKFTGAEIEAHIHLKIYTLHINLNYFE